MTTKRVGIYARYSTDQQSPKTITDQVSNCRDLMARDHPDWREEGIYSDQGKSGMSGRRLGLQRLLADARAGRIDVILMDTNSRLYRKASRWLTLLEELKYAGIRVLSCDGRIDTDDKNFTMMVLGYAMVNQLQVEAGSGQVHTAHRRAFESGHWVGVIPYGYDAVQHHDGRRRNTRLVVNKTEAAVIVQVFGWFVSGWTVYKICQELNERGIPNKRGRPWNYTSLYPNATRCVGMLANPIFVGAPRWNRTRCALHPVTDTRVPVLRDQSELVVHQDEALRIVPQRLWEQAQRRLRDIAAETAQRRRSKPNGAGPGRKAGGYLLSNCLRCGCCGSPVIVVRSGGPRGALYGCAKRRRDPDACRYFRQLRRDQLEEGVFNALETRLFDDAEVNRILAELRDHLSVARGETELADLRRRELQTNKEIDHLLAAVRRGVVSPSLQDDLSRLEHEKNAVAARIVTLAGRGNVVDLLPRHLDRRQRVLGDIRQLAQRDVIAARTTLQKLIGGTITLHQTSRGQIVANLRGSIAGLLDALDARPVLSDNDCQRS